MKRTIYNNKTKVEIKRIEACNKTSINKCCAQYPGTQHRSEGAASFLDFCLLSLSMFICIPHPPFSLSLSAWTVCIQELSLAVALLKPSENVCHSGDELDLLRVVRTEKGQWGLLPLHTSHRPV